MSVIVFVLVLQVLLFRSRWGLRTRAVGEHPRAADTVGVNVIALRYRNVILGGIFAGLAGGVADPRVNASFQNGMTANRGFIALAAVIFGRWTPIGAFGGRAPVHVLGRARGRDPLGPALGRPRRHGCRASRPAIRACTTTSSRPCRTS